MKTTPTILAAGIVLAALANSFGATRYVNVNSASPTPPYTNWATAATTIQDAVDAAVTGDEIVVTNGIYQAGGRAVVGTMTNRVAVDKALTVRSVNGSAVTVIHGYQVPGTTNSDGAVRCVYLTNGAALAGFTLASGGTRTSGDYWREQSGGGVWCESASAVASNCVLRGNCASWGGGGAYQCTLNNCVLTGNRVSRYGGGAAESTLNNCTLTGNSAIEGGGGADGGTLNNCVVTGNSADYGGGASGSTLNNCALTGNSAGHGGGASGGTLNNCTLTGNLGIGAYGSTMNNSIIYYNAGGNYFSDDFSPSALNNCCTTPLPPGGAGNITAEPQLTDLTHLSASSPCRAAGAAAYTSGVDIDGEAWANPPSIGCDEFFGGATTGPLGVAVAADYTNVAAGFMVNLTAILAGRASANRWEFGDGTVVSNRPVSVFHSWSTEGTYAVVFRAYNDSNPAGVSATVAVRVSELVHYVATASGNPLAPYSSWETAASNIQDAVDAAAVGALVLVSNGVYETGGRAVCGTMTNRVAVTKPLTLRSVNGPEVTVIRGYQVPGTTNGDSAVRCVYLTKAATLVGFTLTSGGTQTSGDYWREESGGAVWCESASAVVSNCILSGNSAIEGGGGASGGTLNNCVFTGNSARYGGGAFHCTLNNCTLTGNSASSSFDSSGGGASGGTLNSCTLTGNSASEGGGAAGSILNNCIVDQNMASQGGGTLLSTLNNCTIVGNSAITGGGASGGTLNNCTLVGNSASFHGGGVAPFCVRLGCSGTLNNCIVYYNAAPDGANYSADQFTAPILNYCCTTPLPLNGVGNFTSAPHFVDQAGGNLRLQSNSPCINSGRDAYAPAGPDLDGNPRIVGGTVDVGAYEFQSPQSAISYAWLQQYGLPTDGSADFADGDGDGLNTWQEWRCLTDPTNALSVLRLLSLSPTSTNATVRWQSVAGVNYFLERSTNLPLFMPLATDLIGKAGATTFTDTSGAGAKPVFYRVGVLGVQP